MLKWHNSLLNVYLSILPKKKKNVHNSVNRTGGNKHVYKCFYILDAAECVCIKKNFFKITYSRNHAKIDFFFFFEEACKNRLNRLKES